MRRRGAPAVTLATAFAAAWSPPARAAETDLRDVAARVEAAWRTAGAVTSRLESRFVMEDGTTTIDIRGERPPGECRRVALIGARGMSFHVTAGAGEADDTFRVASTAGVIELQGCGTLPGTVKLKTDSGRGALETVIGASSSAIPPAFTILLERAGGVLPFAPEPGPLPPLPTPAARASAAGARHERDGFVSGPELSWGAGDDGKGGGPLVLEEGCHRLELFASEPRRDDAGRHHPLDLDGVLRREAGEALAEDQSSAPDVRLEACVAASTKVRVTFEGAPRRSMVIMTHGLRPLPLHVPPVWPPELRARMAAMLVARDVRPLTADAVLLARGAAGTTPIPVPLEPGACYVAVAALERGRGRGRGVALHASVGGRSADDEQGVKDGAALVAFCAREEAAARVVVEARSNASGWGVAVFRVLGGAWGEGP